MSTWRTPNAVALRRPEAPLPDITFLRLEGTGRTALVSTPTSYDEALCQARDTFYPGRRMEEIRLLVSMAQIDARCALENVEVTPMSWSFVVGSRNGAALDLGVRALPPTCPSTHGPAPLLFGINVRVTGGRLVPLWVSALDTVLSVKEQMMEHEGVPLDRQILMLAGAALQDDRTLEDSGVSRNTVIQFITRLRGGKPVIYLFSPTTLRASVQLTLTPHWSFSCIYPPEKIACKAGDQEVRWSVEVRKDRLVDLATGNDEAYLFWEALSNPPNEPPDALPDSRPGSPEQPISLAFNPSKPVIESKNSVVLSVEQVPAYLQKALAALHLHVEARTSFITYWLPDIQKHKHVALRFLPQEEYEQAARLDISPAPEIVTRVFMLFRGLCDQDAHTWRATSMSATSPSCWKSVVGVKDCAADESLYRALEWGGMEVRG